MEPNLPIIQTNWLSTPTQYTLFWVLLQVRFGQDAMLFRPVLGRCESEMPQIPQVESLGCNFVLEVFENVNS